MKKIALSCYLIFLFSTCWAQTDQIKVKIKGNAKQTLIRLKEVLHHMGYDTEYYHDGIYVTKPHQLQENTLLQIYSIIKPVSDSTEIRIYGYKTGIDSTPRRVIDSPRNMQETTLCWKELTCFAQFLLKIQ